MKIYKDTKILHPGQGIDLETKTFYADRGVPIIVAAPGLGRCAQRDEFVDGLIRGGFAVRMLSPRNSGLSTGHLTIENFIDDTSLVIEDTAQGTGKRPLGLGFSMGGYVLARLLQDKQHVEKAVLLSPLINVREENPSPVDWCIQYLVNAQKTPRALKFFCDFWTGKISPFPLRDYGTFITLDEQMFSTEEAMKFLNSFYNALPCTTPMQSPTYVVLTGKTTFGLKIRNLKEMEQKWKALQMQGSIVDAYPGLDHWFAEQGYWFQKSKGFFQSEKREYIIKRGAEFLSA